MMPVFMNLRSNKFNSVGKKLVTAFSFVCLILPIVSIAGPGSTGGADLSIYDANLSLDLRNEMNQKILDLVLQQAKKLGHRIADPKFKTDLIEMLSNEAFINSLPGKTKSTVTALIEQGLFEDITNTTYNYQPDKKCFVSAGNEKFLTTRNNIKADPICVDPVKFFLDFYKERKVFAINDRGNIVQEKFYVIPDWIVFGLFIHDHARHFGVLDEDHSLVRALSRAHYNFPKAKVMQSKDMSRVLVSGQVATGDLRLVLLDVELKQGNLFTHHTSLEFKYSYYKAMQYGLVPSNLTESSYSFAIYLDDILTAQYEKGMKYKDASLIFKTSTVLTSFKPRPIVDFSKDQKKEYVDGFRIEFLKIWPNFNGEITFKDLVYSMSIYDTDYSP